MGKFSDSDGEELFPQLSDMHEGSEDALHTTQINLPPEAFERFTDTFERAAQRWERIVYPGMFVMVAVMAYGFFLILNLSNDMRQIAESFDPHMSKHMASLSKNMQEMTGSINRMHKDMQTIARVMPEMNDKLDAMSSMPIISTQMTIMNKRMQVMNVHMEGMNREMRVMNGKMNVMTGNIVGMNRNISRPMNFMNSFMPW